MSIVQELKRRNVFRVAIAYLTGAWLLVEVAEAVAKTGAERVLEQQKEAALPDKSIVSPAILESCRHGQHSPFPSWKLMPLWHSTRR